MFMMQRKNSSHRKKKVFLPGLWSRYSNFRLRLQLRSSNFFGSGSITQNIFGSGSGSSHAKLLGLRLRDPAPAPQPWFPPYVTLYDEIKGRSSAGLPPDGRRSYRIVDTKHQPQQN